MSLKSKSSEFGCGKKFHKSVFYLHGSCLLEKICGLNKDELCDECKKKKEDLNDRK